MLIMFRNMPLKGISLFFYCSFVQFQLKPLTLFKLHEKVLKIFLVAQLSDCLYREYTHTPVSQLKTPTLSCSSLCINVHTHTHAQAKTKKQSSVQMTPLSGIKVIFMKEKNLPVMHSLSPSSSFWSVSPSSFDQLLIISDWLWSWCVLDSPVCAMRQE